MSTDCEVVEREFLLVGESVTVNFPDAFPDAAINVQMSFGEKRDRIGNAVNKEVMFSPYMCNDIMATYFACLEVTDLDQIPEGMVGFKIPKAKYAKASCTTKSVSQGYEKVFAFMEENSLKQKWFAESFPVEIYYFQEEGGEEPVEILIPLEESEKN
ncbi:GyrI-like domain-containing protein [Alteribacter natronophilus]|nr:GyrI-like domain-containing protein [Alteribacter natronophilus]